MPLNNPTQSIIDVYQPRLSIQLNGQDLPMALSADVTTNNWYQADRASAEFSLFNDPNFGAKFWGSQDTMLLDIRYVLGQAAPVSLILGQVDHIDIDWLAGKVRLEMRDLTSNFIDHRTYGSFLNKTSSQIATELATKYGMQADVDTTSTPVGRYYESEHDEVSDGEFNKSITEWDLLTFLAQNEGDATTSFNVWVTGQTLHFKKATPIDTSNPWIITTQVPQLQASVPDYSPAAERHRIEIAALAHPGQRHHRGGPQLEQPAARRHYGDLAEILGPRLIHHEEPGAAVCLSPAQSEQGPSAEAGGFHA